MISIQNYSSSREKKFFRLPRDTAREKCAYSDQWREERLAEEATSTSWWRWMKAAVFSIMPL